MSEYLIKDYYKSLSETTTQVKINNKKIHLYFIAYSGYIAVAWGYKSHYIMETFNTDEFRNATVFEFYDMIIKMSKDIAEDLISDKEKEKEYKKHVKHIRKTLKLTEASIYDIPIERSLYDLIEENIEKEKDGE